MYQAADGFFYYFKNKSIPIGTITACAADAADPGQRTNTDPTGEERYTFTLSAERDCDGNVGLTTTSLQAWPFLYHRRSQHLPARHCCQLSLAVPEYMNVYMDICITYDMCKHMHI
jgi:hypothetical protein